MLRLSTWLACSLLAAVVTLAGCGREPAGGGEPPTARVRIAEVVEVVPEVRSRHLVLLEPWRRAELSPRYGGQISELLVAEQDAVEAGQQIVGLVDADARGSLLSAQASRASSRKRLADLETQLADARALFDSGAGTRREVERLETEVATTRDTIRQASGQVIQSRDRRAANSIVAPFAGVITTLGAELGEYASPGTPLATLSELDTLRVDVPLSEYEILVHERSNLRFELRVRGELITAKLEWIAREAEAGTNTFPARLRIDNGDRRLRAGETVEVTVRGERGEAVRVVPPTAVRWEAEQAYLLRATAVASEQGEAREQLERVDVVVREDVGSGVAVEGPLAIGDRIVSSGPATLVDGDEAIAVPYLDERAPGPRAAAEVQPD